MPVSYLLGKKDLVLDFLLQLPTNHNVSRAQQNIKALTLASKMELFQKLQLKMGSASILLVRFSDSLASAGTSEWKNL